ncbi:MAG: hypothetical protein Q7J45_03990 [bacterium]|nr:hypothetical protein [bacterium]
MEPITMARVAEAFAAMSLMEIGALFTLMTCLAIMGICKVSPTPRPNKHIH